MCVVSLVFAKRVVRAGPVGRKGFLETAVKKIGRMTIITEVLVQIKSNKREGKKHLAQGWSFVSFSPVFDTVATRYGLYF